MTKLLIREDGMVFAHTADRALQPGMRPYNGPIPVSREQGLAWLQGGRPSAAAGGAVLPTEQVQAGPAVTEPLQPEAVLSPPLAPVNIDLATATREAIIAHIDQRFGRKFPSHWSLDIVKRRAAELLGVEDPAESDPSLMPAVPPPFAKTQATLEASF